MMSDKLQSREKLNMGSAISYAIGSSGANASFYMINNYLMLFYTDVVTLSAAAISAIMLIARIWDAINDPMMGMVEDRTHTRLGKFRPWLIVGPPFLALFNILTFTVFPLTGKAKVLVCGICYIGAGMAYTVVQVAVNGLVNRITEDSQNKMTVISIAQVANQLGQVAIAAILMPVILYFSNSDVANARGYFWGTLFVCIVTVPMIWISAWKCREVTTSEPEAAVKNLNEPKTSVWTSLKKTFQNDQLRVAVATTFLSCVSVIGRFGLLSYYIIYVVGSYTMIAPVFSIMSIAQMLGNLPIPFLTRKFGKKQIYIAGNMLSAATMVSLFFLSGRGIGVVIALSAVIGFLGGVSSITYALVCDCVEYGDWKYGIRDDGLAFSLMSFGVKLASAITGAIGVPLLIAVGYMANQAQAPQTVTAINAIVNILPAVILAIALLPLAKYRLDNLTMAKISDELKQKREGKAAES
jgi:sugar (glycoside-pentoside-hexuronide) transporter